MSWENEYQEPALSPEELMRAVNSRLNTYYHWTSGGSGPSEEEETEEKE